MADVWTQEDVAAFLKCDVKTVQRLEKRGAFTGVAVPGRTDARPIKRYDEAEIRAWWTTQVTAAQEAAAKARAGSPPVRVAGRLAARAIRVRNDGRDGAGEAAA